MAKQPEVVGEVFNFSNETQLTVLELTKKIMLLMGSYLEPKVLSEASNEILHQSLSAEKARRMLGWKPQHSIDSALAETIAWYREFLESEKVLRDQN